jgi:RNA polymerase sigma factor (sigma-70 family)
MGRPAILREPLGADRRALAARWLALAYKGARQWQRRFPHLDPDDLDDAAVWALCAAARNWRPDGGAHFAHYLKTAVRNALGAVARKYRGRPDRLPDGVADLYAAPADPPDRPWLWRAVDALPDRERRAVTLRFRDGLDSFQIGEQLGCTWSAARSLVWRGLMRLRTDLEGAA